MFQKLSTLNSQLSTPKGFTLVEILVVVAIAGILSAIGITAFATYSRQQALNQQILFLKNNLRIAQSKALSQEVPVGCNQLSAYELKFTGDGTSYTVSPICSGAPGVSVVSVTFPTGIRRVSGPAFLRFKLLTGAVENSGTILLTDATGATKTVEVTPVGGIK